MKSFGRAVAVVSLLGAAVIGVTSCEKSSGDDGLTYVLVRDITVSARAAGVQFQATTSAVHRFTIVDGAYSLISPPTDWETEVLFYKNRPIEWQPEGEYPGISGYDGIIGYWNPKPTAAEATAAALGTNERISLEAGETVIFVVPDCQTCFGDNTGSVTLRIERGM
jgi:hypothetical protein